MITPRLIIDNKPLYYEPIHIYPSCITLDISERIIVEIGPGRGDFLFYIAEKNPDAKVVGIEIKNKRFLKLMKRVELRGFNNIALVKADAREALPQLFKRDSVEAIHILFPDPWPKRRHAPHRLINEVFLKDCLNVLKLRGELNLVTDSIEYAENGAFLLLKIAGFKSVYNPPIITSVQDTFETYFAKKWKEEGRTLYYQKYLKVDFTL